MKYSASDYVIFSWVLHREEILNGLLERLDDLAYELEKITLICSEETLKERMELDNRSQEQISNSIERLRFYNEVKTNKLDTSDRTIEEIVERIKNIIQ